jgi:hypothetical protein
MPNFWRQGSSLKERIWPHQVSPMTEIAEHAQTERDRVAGWRLHVLIEAGYPVHLAERLAHSEADLHRAVELVRQGCDATVAAEILV